jgi:glycosyltransferase involved in cell wall biosynthesis
MKFSVIVPTLNEARYLPRLLKSLQAQTSQDFQVIVVDGGSLDSTQSIAESFGAKVFVLNGSPEFPARNFGASHSQGSLLIFTCADVVLPKFSLEKIETLVDRGEIEAITGPDVPYDGDAILRVLYSAYNLLRLISAKLPYPVKAFSTSTNFLVVRREIFERSGGFKASDVNADGLMGQYLASRRKVSFDGRVVIYISARRATSWGMPRFIRHYFYVLENFFPPLSKRQWFQSMKSRSRKTHGQIHTEASG